MSIPWFSGKVSVQKKRVISSLIQRFFAGFTFLELLIITLICGIISILSWPSLSAALEDDRLNGAASETVTALVYAHLKAVNYGRKIRISESYQF